MKIRRSVAFLLVVAVCSVSLRVAVSGEQCEYGCQCSQWYKFGDFCMEQDPRFLGFICRPMMTWGPELDAPFPGPGPVDIWTSDACNEICFGDQQNDADPTYNGTFITSGSQPDVDVICGYSS